MAEQRIGPSSAPLTLTNAEFALAGPSRHLDPTIHAYRRDLADVALAGQVIASHYAEATERRIAAATQLQSAPSTESETLAELAGGELFLVLEDGAGWSWGYGGPNRLVGYVRSDALSAT